MIYPKNDEMQAIIPKNYISLSEIINAISVSSGIGEIEAEEGIIFANDIIDEINEEGFYFPYFSLEEKDKAYVFINDDYLPLVRQYLNPLLKNGIIAKALFEGQDLDDGTYNIAIRKFMTAKARIINDLGNLIDNDYKAKPKRAIFNKYVNRSPF